MESQEIEPFALPVSKAAKLIGRSPSLLWQEIRLGRLRAFKPQRGYRTKQVLQNGVAPNPATYVLVEDLKKWVCGEHVVGL